MAKKKRAKTSRLGPSLGRPLGKLVDGFNHLEKYESQRVSDDIPYMKWTIKVMFETTNQWCSSSQTDGIFRPFSSRICSSPTPNFFGEQPEVRNPEIRKKKKTPVMLAHVQLLVHVLRPSPAEPSAAICSFQWMFWVIKRWDIDYGDGYKHV